MSCLILEILTGNGPWPATTRGPLRRVSDEAGSIKACDFIVSALMLLETSFGLVTARAGMAKAAMARLRKETIFAVSMLRGRKIGRCG